MNSSGWSPVEFNCLVRVDEVQEKTKGGIYLPDAKRDEDKLASVEALLIDVSPLAFSYEVWPAGARKPQSGDRILMAKYAGSPVKGTDGGEYRVIKDKDILAVRTGS
jgi:co-chaperonin GroES (HSP10)